MISLVTGGAGFIGSHLVEYLLQAGHKVIVIDNESANNEEFYWNPNTDCNRVDVCNYEKSRPLYEGVDYVFHLAAESRLQPAIENPIEAVYKNCVGTTVALQCAREAGVTNESERLQVATYSTVLEQKRKEQQKKRFKLF